MPESGLIVQMAQIEALERAIIGLQQSVAVSLRAARESRSLSLRDVAPHVGLTAAALHNLERGKSWRTPSARRVAEYYDRAA